MIQSITDTINKICDSNQNVIKEEIQSQLEKTYNIFAGTGEKSSAHYMSRFILGESLVLRDYNKHIFVYDKESYIPTKTVINDHVTHSKRQKIENIVDSSNAINSIVFIPVSSPDSPAILVNIIDVNRGVVVNNIRLDSVLVGNRKIAQLNIQFNIDRHKESFKEYCNIKLLKIYNSISEYNRASIPVKGKLHLVDANISSNLLYHLQQAISSQAGLVISESQYKELFGKIGEIVYPIKSLIGRESEFQGLLEGIFKYYSDVKLSEESEDRALVLTEFQTGAGERIDMLVQALGSSQQGTKEDVPVGLELKYDRSIHLRSFEKSKSIEEQAKLLNDKAKHVIEKLLRDQTERYFKGAAIKSITDGNKVAVMGIVFNPQAERADSLLLTTDRFYEAAIIHSSKLYSVSDITNINTVADVFEVSDISIDACNHYEFNESNMEMLINALKANVNIQNINISNNNIITTGALKNLCDYLKNHKNAITGINLASSNLNNDKVELLKDLLHENRNIIHINISDNDTINTQTIDDVKKLVYENQKVSSRLKDRYNSYTLDGLKSKYAPEWIDIECCRLETRITTFENSDDFDNFLNHLAVDTQRLDLFGLGVNDDMIDEVCKYLSSKNIDFLDLSRNEITSDGAEILLQYLLSNRYKISYLDISHNKIASKKFIETLAQFINNNHNNALAPVLKFLSLSNTGLGKDLENNNSEEMLYIKRILNALQKNTSIERLDISYNYGMFNIKNQNDVDHIANMMLHIIHHHPKLSTLNLSETGINGLLISYLAYHCKNNNPERASIVDLNISRNDINMYDMEKLSYFIGRLKKLKHLDISKNNIQWGVTFLLNSLQDTSITSLKMSSIELIGDDDSIETGFKNLLEKTSINVLDISGNYVGINVLSTIFLAIGNRVDKTLTTLNVSGNKIDINKDMESIISRAIRNNDILRSLDMV